MRTAFLFPLFFLIALQDVWCADPPQADYRLTLEQCIEYAMSSNYTRATMKLTEEARRDVYEQSRTERLPDLNAALSETYIHSGTASVAASQAGAGTSTNENGGNKSRIDGIYSLNSNIQLYQGGALGKTMDKNKLSMEQSRVQTEQYDNNLTIQILQAFLSVLSNDELMKSQQELLITSEEQLSQGKVQFEAGAIIESDYLLLQAQYAMDQNNIVNSRAAYENSLSSLKTLLSMDSQDVLEIVPPQGDSFDALALLPAQADVVEQAMEVLPDLKINQYSIEIAQAGVKLAKTNFIPSVNLGGSLGSGHRTDFFVFGQQLVSGFTEQLALSVNVPIFNRNRYRSLVTQNRIQAKQAEFDKEQTRIQLEQTVVQQYNNVMANYSQYRSTGINRDAYQKSFEAYSTKFDEGAITVVMLLQQKNGYINATVNYIQSKYTFILNRKILDVYMGEKVKM